MDSLLEIARNLRQERELRDKKAFAAACGVEPATLPHGPAPCTSCGNPFLWVDPFGNAHCRNCSPASHPAMIRQLILVIGHPGAYAVEPISQVVDPEAGHFEPTPTDCPRRRIRTDRRTAEPAVPAVRKRQPRLG
jgi:hypothetical protein